MSDEAIYTIHEPDRDSGTLIYASTPGLEMPKGILRIPGYRDKIWEVKRGQREPFWGSEYQLDGRGRLADLVRANSMLYAASQRLKDLFEGAGVKGVLYHQVRVGGRTPMYILGVPGEVGVHPVGLDLQLLEGAEVGIYGNTFIHVSARVAGLIQEAGFDMLVEPAKLHPEPP